MAVTPINVARVSHNLRAFSLLNTIRATNAGLFGVQNQLATGLKFMAPSEDSVGAAHVQALSSQIEKIEAVSANLRHANATLSAVESAMQDALNLLTGARSVALEQVGDTVSADDRIAAAQLVTGMVDQLVAIANRKHLDQYLFSGHRTGSNPFTLDGVGVRYGGDGGRSYAIAETDGSQEHFTIAGMEFFSAASTGVQGVRDLDPALTAETRVSDLRGTSGLGVRLGRITVSDGAQRSEIDLSGVDTVGDIIERLNAEMPNSLSAALTATGIVVTNINNAATVTITDVGAGQAARDLGLHAPTPVASVAGGDLNPRLTARTALSDLLDGTGIDTQESIIIRNGSRTAVIDLSTAETFEDVLNLINESELGVRATIGEDDTLSVVNLVSGTALSIGENGGTLATELGIRSNYANTRLSELNDGRGVQTVEGADIRLVTANGTTIEVDIDGAETIQDVLDVLNTAGGGSITASLATTGNGIVIRDNTSGGGTFRIERANLSPAIDGLGLNRSATGNRIEGTDTNPQTVDSAFTALIELRAGLNANDRQAITAAAERLDRVIGNMQRVQGQAASQAKAMLDRTERMADVKTSTQVLLSEVRDVDISEAVVRFQQLQTALQANLVTASRISDLSLINYLR